MPDIERITNVTHSPNDPYHWVFDNMPLENIIQRINLVNTEVDKNSQEISGARGTAPTLTARMNQSLEDNGDIRTSAIDNAGHSISSHTDDENYVRMTVAERDKLALVADGATNFRMGVQGPSEVILFGTQTVLTNSDSITWEYSSNVTKANLNFPISIAHQHYYDAEPEMLSAYQNYRTPTGRSYIPGKLRVFINGIRLNPDVAVYVPAFDGSAGMSLKFSESVPASGTFVLSAPISAYDIVRIDFDNQLS